MDRKEPSTPEPPRDAMRTRIPVPGELGRELIDFWSEVFGDIRDVALEVLLGEEAGDNHNVLFMQRRGDRLAGTCLLTVPPATPAVGGIGEVATRPEFRGTGIATELCGMAVGEFRDRGGRALFLGTGNPNAARLYHRHGWRKLAGADVMANVTGGDPPGAFLVDYFRAPAAGNTVGTGSPADRVPMIPLLLAPHDWRVLDANAKMQSTRHAVQRSCMGLYSRYDAVAADGRGAWFSARTEDGRVVGLATARLQGGGACRVDGFAHALHSSAWRELIRAAIAWATSNGASTCYAEVASDDEEKSALLEAFGFRDAGRGDGFDLAGAHVGSRRLEVDG